MYSKPEVKLLKATGTDFSGAMVTYNGSMETERDQTIGLQSSSGRVSDVGSKKQQKGVQPKDALSKAGQPINPQIKDM